MSVKTVVTRLTADVSGFVAGMGKATAAAQTLAGKTAALSDSQHWKGLSSTALKAGAVIAGGLGLVAKAAVDWESAWAGVRKTVDGTGPEMAQLEGELRNLARTLPASHKEIAAVAEAAGQLGIKRQDVAGFTKVMVDLAETTNLTADEAATSLAQLMNIMGTSASQVSRLGAAVVALGNDGASTEREIVQMGQRIAAAGRQVGMAETDVLAMANALASVGVEAEAGGTAVSMSMFKIDAAVRNGGEKLETLARITGRTADEFARAWQQDAGSAMADVVEGLGRIQSEGGSVKATLKDLGIAGIRESDAMSRLAAATKNAGNQHNLLRDSLILGKKAWQDNTALADEARKRYETSASQIQVAWNNITDAAITFGGAALPVINNVAQAVVGLTQWFGNLPEPVRNASLAFAGLAAAGLLATGGLMKTITAINNVKVALAGLNISARTAGLAAAGIGLALTIAGAAFAAWTAKNEEAKQSTQEYAQALRETNGVIDDSVRALAARKLQEAGALDAANKLGVSYQLVTEAALGNEAAISQVNEAIKEYRNQSTYRQGGGGQVLTEEGQAWKTLSDAIQGQSGALGEAIEKERQFQEAASRTGGAAEQNQRAVQNLSKSYEAQKEVMDALLKATQEYGNELLALSGSEIGLEQAIDDASDALKKNGKTLDINTQKGRNNKQALDTIAKSGMSLIKTLVEQNASTDKVTAAQKRASDAFVAAAVKAGMTKKAATELAAAYFALPPAKETKVSAPGAAESKARVENLHNAIKNLPDWKQTLIKAALEQGGIAAAEAALARLTRTRYSTVVIRTQQVTGGSTSTGGTKQIGYAQGAVVDYYARGGLREQHVAQIAPAGAMRVWAEPETGGEAYIPLALSKRERSEAILEEVARRFGRVMLADGAVLQPGTVRTPAPTATHTQTIIVEQVSPDALRAVLNGARIDITNGQLLFDQYATQRERAANLAGRTA